MRVPQVSERIKEAPAQVLRGVFAGIGQLLLYTDKLRNKTPSGQPARYARAPGPAPTPTSRSAPTEPAPASATASAPADQDVAEPAVAETPKTPRAPRTPKTPRAPKTPAAAKTPGTPKAPAAGAEIRDFDKTGNVRLLTGDEDRADDEPPAAAKPAPTAEVPVPPAAAEEPVPPAAAEPEVTPAAAAEAELTPAAAAEAEVTPAAAAEAEVTPAAAEPTGGPAGSGAPLPNYDELSVASLRARLRNLDVTQVRCMAEYEKAHAARADVIVMFERRIAKLEAGD